MGRKRLKIPLSIERVLDDTLKDLGLEVKMKQNRVWTLWNEVVGPKIRDHAQPTRIRGGRLFVAVEDSMWLHQLNFLRHDILMELNGRLGKAIIKDLVLRVGEVNAYPIRAGEMDRPAPAHQPLAREDEEKMQEILSPVKERDCQEVLRRVLLLHFRGKESSQ